MISRIALSALLVCAVLWIAPLPLAAVTVVVNSAADPGNGGCDAVECTFREAIERYFYGSGVDRIAFAIPGNGPFTITLSADLMTSFLTFKEVSGLTIDGYTQPGAQPNTASSGSNAVLKIIIDGAGQYRGFELRDQNVIRGVVLQRFHGAAIWAKGDDNVIAGCFIGTDATGTIALGNTTGIYIHDPLLNPPYGPPTDALRNRIGGGAPADRNVISGNAGDGIGLSGTLLGIGGPGYKTAIVPKQTMIEGNLIGLSASGASGVGNGRYGLSIALGSDNVIRGNVVSGNALGGIFIAGTSWICCPPQTFSATGNVIAGNFIGTSSSGTAALPNDNGIYFGFGAGNNLIGGETVVDRNVVSGNSQDGIVLETAYGTRLVGNFIGTDISGNEPLGNGASGIKLVGAGAVLGDLSAGSGNVIAANSGPGVLLQAKNNVPGFMGPENHGSSVKARRNLIGRGTGGAALGNGGGGVVIDAALEGTPNSHSVIGDFDPALGNVIQNNGGNGVTIRSGDDNAVLSNTIDSNVGLGIDLNDDGPTPNDPLDGDSGPNGLQNYPVITALENSPAGWRVTGTLDSTPSSQFKVQLFDSQSASQLRNSFDVTTDGSGHAAFDVLLSAGPPANLYATATNLTSMATSELSPAFLVNPAAIPVFSPVTLALLALVLAVLGAAAVKRHV